MDLRLRGDYESSFIGNHNSPSWADSTSAVQSLRDLLTALPRLRHGDGAALLCGETAGAPLDMTAPASQRQHSPPAEAKARYYAQTEGVAMAA